jgi:hypothetical protein
MVVRTWYYKLNHGEDDITNSTNEEHDCKKKVMYIKGKIRVGANSHRGELIKAGDGQN